MIIKLPQFTWKIGLSLLVAVFIPEIVYYYYLKHFKNYSRRDDEYCEILFFTDKGVKCKQHCYKKIVCSADYCAYRNLRRLCELLESATKALDVCIYLMTCQEISQTIIKVSKKGVAVRVIADGGMTDCSGSQITALRENGVPVRMKKSAYIMHHKFAIIDNKTLLTGSCNWTMQGLTGNWDNIIVTKFHGIVEPFCQEFSTLWEEFSD